jgi:nicotinamide mononucleotide adenylyltransferase
MKAKKIILCGLFSPIHRDHIEHFQNVNSKGDELFVLVNSAFQRESRQSRELQKEDHRIFCV